MLMSHLGRPMDRFDPTASLRPVSDKLAELLGTTVKLAPSCIGAEAEALAKGLLPGEVLLLENLRFHPGEEAGELQPPPLLVVVAEPLMREVPIDPGPVGIGGWTATCPCSLELRGLTPSAG